MRIIFEGDDVNGLNFESLDFKILKLEL